MRIFKCVLIVICFLGTYVSSAFAVEGIKFDFHGKMFQVFGTTNNGLSLAGKHKSGPTDFFSYEGNLNSGGLDTKYLEFFNSVGTTFGLSKARLRFEAQTEDKLAKFVYGLEVGTMFWGDKDKKFGLSGDGVTQESRFVYAEVKAVQNRINHTIRAGLQPTKISNWVWSETAAGLTYHGKTNQCNWMIGWYRGDEDTTANSADNNYFVFKTEGELTSDLNLGFFAIYENSGSETTSKVDPDGYTFTYLNNYDRINQYIGITAKLTPKPFFANVEFIYQFGDIDFVGDRVITYDNKALGSETIAGGSNEEKDLDRGAYLLNVEAGLKMNDQLTLSFNSLYVSGDDNPHDQDVDNFDAIDVDVKVGMILFKDSLTASCDRFVSDAPYLLDKGLIHNAVMASYKPDKKHSFFSAIRYMSLAEDVIVDNKKESSIGTELDFKYAYKFNKYTILHFESAVLIPGSASDALVVEEKRQNGEDAETIFNIAAGIQFKF